MDILLVDDEEQFRSAVMRQLSIRDYNVSEVSSGNDAIEFIHKNNIDVVVLDMRMPGLSGTATLETIKKEFPLTEVIMLTGHATVSTAMESIRKGAFDYITKPVKLDELINKMEDAYKQKKIKERKIRHKETVNQYKSNNNSGGNKQ